MDSKLGKYIIHSTLGTGGMGVVYLAEDALLSRNVALKVLRPEFTHDPERRSRFLREARAASALNHPNIITVYEIGESEGRWYIATEFVKGKTLSEYAENSKLNIQLVVAVTVQVADALAAAHSGGILHRDVKPENVMVRDDLLVKVLDFGLAKLIDDASRFPANSGDRLMTTAGLVLGTPAYMSPEQARGLEVDGRTDVWSLGVCLYEMLTGKPPFIGETASDIIAAILMTNPAASRDFGVEIPEQLRLITLTALSKDPSERYQSMADFLSDLKSFTRRVELDDEHSSVKTKREALGAGGSEKATQILHPPAVTSRRSRNAFRNLKLHKLALTFMLLLSASGLVTFLFTNVDRDEHKKTTLAVMPFANIGGRAETEYLADGITESLINDLSRLPGLIVKARSSVFRYKGKEADPQTLGEELVAEMLVIGRVAERPDGLRLNLEVVEARTGNLIWGHIYDRGIDDLVGLQKEVALDVSRQLGNQFPGLEAEQADRRYASDSEVYRLYLNGRYYLNSRDPGNFEKAIRYFERVLERSPDYALAHAGLSDTYTELSYWSFGLPEATMPKARAAALRAIASDETLSEGHGSLAYVAEDYDWDFSLAEREYIRAIGLDPNNAIVLDRYGGFLCERARFREGHQKLDRATELDPLSPTIGMSRAACFYQERRFDEAVNSIEKIVTDNPDYTPAYSLLGAIYLRQGNIQGTVEAWLKNSLLEHYSPEQLLEWRRSFNSGGIDGFLRKDIEFRKDAARRGRNQSLFIAMQYANVGEKELALDWLDKAYRERHGWLES